VPLTLVCCFIGTGKWARRGPTKRANQLGDVTGGSSRARRVDRARR
jgi:hypothetical protein